MVYINELEIVQSRKILFVILILKYLLLKSSKHTLYSYITFIISSHKNYDLFRLINKGIDNYKIISYYLNKINASDLMQIVNDYYFKGNLDYNKFSNIIYSYKIKFIDMMDKINIFITIIMIMFYFIPFIVILFIIFYNINMQYYVIILVIIIFYMSMKYKRKINNEKE